jgi:thioester reductase-like protein
MTNLTDRIANLSPHQRALLMQRLKEKQLDSSLDSPGTPGDQVDLQAEAQLDPTIIPAVGKAIPMAQATAIFLTGATGFLGAFLLTELLQKTRATFYCLVRAADPAEGLERIRKNLQGYGLWRDRYSDRLIPVPGDLAKPQFGLASDEFQQLAATLDGIYHCAASLNFVYPYSGMKPMNVLGTQEILRLACLNRPKTLHYMSTFGVFESPAYAGKVVAEDTPLEHSENMFLGYAQSKWVAEKLVWIARDRGLPISIYRLPLITGHSKTGVWNTNDFTCLLSKGCTQMRAFPDLHSDFSYAPVDYVAHAVAYLSRKPENLGHNFHLNNPHPIDRDAAIAWSLSAGYPLEYLPYEEWQTRLIWASRKQNNVLATLQPFFLQRWSEEQLSVPEMYEKGRMPEVRCQATLNALAGSGITCPPLDSKLLSTYFFYFLQTGFLDAEILGRSWFMRFQILFLLTRPWQWVRAMKQGQMKFTVPPSPPPFLSESADRPLGLNEQMMESLNRQATTYTMVISSRIKGPLTTEILRQALIRLRQRHPRLNVRIVGALGDLRFETWDTVTPPLRVVMGDHKDYWQTVVREELNTPIKATQGLWRMVLVRSPEDENTSHLIMTLHHAIADGLSSIQLQAELFTACQNLAAGEPLNLEPLPPTPPLESFLPPSSQGFAGFINAWLFSLKLMSQRLWHRPQHLPLEESAPIPNRRCNVIYHELDETFTQAFVARCKQEKTSVQGAIAAASLIATRQKLSPSDRSIYLGCQSIVDLRRRLTGAPIADHPSLFATSFMSYHKVDRQTPFWDLARQVKQHLDTGTQGNYILRYPLVAKYFMEYYLKHPEEVTVSTFLTNIGQVNIPHQYGSFELEDICFTASNRAFIGTFAAAISTFRGKMQLNHVFAEPALSQATVEEVAHQMRMILAAACQP